MDIKTLICEYKRVCELILAVEIELFETRKDSIKQSLLRSAQDYKDALWELIIRTKGDPYND